MQTLEEKDCFLPSFHLLYARHLEIHSCIDLLDVLNDQEEVSLKHKKVIMITRTNHKVNNSRKRELREVTGYRSTPILKIPASHILRLVYYLCHNVVSLLCTNTPLF